MLDKRFALRWASAPKVSGVRSPRRPSSTGPSTPRGVSAKLNAVEEVGTRHRAAYRFVQRHPSGIAVVISHDGAVSFVANRDGAVVSWQQSVSR